MFSATGSNEQSIPRDLPSGTLVRLTPSLSPTARVEMNEPNWATFPPMLLKSPANSVYQKVEGFHITSQDIPSIISSDSSAAIQVFGIEGCFYEASIEGHTCPLGIRSLNGKWTLGRGNKHRFWSGEVTLTLETAELQDFN